MIYNTITAGANSPFPFTLGGSGALPTDALIKSDELRSMQQWQSVIVTTSCYVFLPCYLEDLGMLGSLKFSRFDHIYPMATHLISAELSACASVVF